MSTTRPVVEVDEVDDDTGRTDVDGQAEVARVGVDGAHVDDARRQVTPCTPVVHLEGHAHVPVGGAQGGGEALQQGQLGADLVDAVLADELPLHAVEVAGVVAQRGRLDAQVEGRAPRGSAASRSPAAAIPARHGVAVRPHRLPPALGDLDVGRHR